MIVEGGGRTSILLLAGRVEDVELHLLAIDGDLFPA
jgi:hypothetical protein